MSLESKFNSLFSEPTSPLQFVTRETGTPIFTEEDIRRSTNELDVLVRTLMVKEQVTHAWFAEQYWLYASENWGEYSSSDITSAKNNLLRALIKGDITIKRFMETMRAVFGRRVVDIEVTLQGADSNDTTSIALHDAETIGQDQ